MSKHTPGPWVVNPLQLDQVCTADAHSVIAFAQTKGNLNNTIANARLIAAAPELLEVLKLMRHRFLDTEGSHSQWEQEATDAADAAIAKAEGL